MLLKCMLAVMSISGAPNGPEKVNNPIDALLQKRYLATKIAFPQCDDQTFLRRVWLDACGTLPDEIYLAKYRDLPHPWNRTDIINEALDSQAFVRRWVNFIEEYLGLDAHAIKEIHSWFGQQVETDRPWDEVVRDLLHFDDFLSSIDKLPFLNRMIGMPLSRHDSWDDQVAYITDKFLGLETRCISCHDGAYHLEDVNVYLSTKTRADFWGLAAFVASSGYFCPSGDCFHPNGLLNTRNMKFTNFDAEGFNIGNGHFFEYSVNGLVFSADHPTQYVADTDAGDGMRPPRNGGVVQPHYFFTEQAPSTGPLQRERFSDLLTQDRQFARNMANRLWKHFFGTAFVTPFNAFDLARLDAKTAAAFSTTVQPHDPELMELVTDWFVAGDFRFHHFFQMILGSSLYQLDYAKLPPSQHGSVGPYWGGSRRVRPMEGEALMDAVSRAANFFPSIISVPYVFDGEEFHHAWSMPNPNDPNSHPGMRPDDWLAEELCLDENRTWGVYLDEIHGILNAFGRAKRDTAVPRPDSVRSELASTVLNSTWITDLILVKSPVVQQAYDAWTAGTWDASRVVEGFFWRALQRMPTSVESELIAGHLEETGGIKGVREAMWLVLNHPEFIFK